MPMMVYPRHHPIHELVVTNVKFFGNGSRRMLEPPSSGDGKRSIKLIGAQGPLHTGLRRGILVTCLMR